MRQRPIGDLAPWCCGDEKTLDIGVHARWPAGTVDRLVEQPHAFVEGGLDYWGSTIGGPGQRQADTRRV